MRGIRNWSQLRARWVIYQIRADVTQCQNASRVSPPAMKCSHSADTWIAAALLTGRGSVAGRNKGEASSPMGSPIAPPGEKSGAFRCIVASDGRKNWRERRRRADYPGQYNVAYQAQSPLSRSDGS